LNEAITKRDRARLEQLYADEFQLIRRSGGVINKATRISGIMSSDPIASTPVPAPDRRGAEVRIMSGLKGEED
jgi:hypothetical protein